MLSPILNVATGQWTIGRIENHTAKPMSGAEIEALCAEIESLRKAAARLRWLHTGGSSGARKEWGVAEIEFDANGKVIGALWGLSDSSDIDKAMEAEFADENPALAMNRPETYGLPE